MWSKIIGHKKQIDQLRRDILAKRLAQAYVFSGPAGIGKRLAADVFVSAIFCPESAGGDAGACGSCISCRKIASGSHPDLFLVSPEESERGAVTSIKIDTVRELIRKLMYRPLEAPAKVAIIDGADRMMQQASNALLKCMEEPPEGTHFILITPYPQSLLPTIRSRCRIVSFTPLKDDEVASAVAERAGFAREDALRIARISGGSIGAALGLDPEFVREVIGRLVPLISGASSADILEAAEAFNSMKPEKTQLIFDVLASWYLDLLRISASITDKPPAHPEAAAAAARFSETRAAEALANINAARLSADTAANKQLMFENLLFTLTG